MTRFPTPSHLTSWAKFAPGIRSCFTRLDLQRVEAQTIVDNHASVRLLRRLGFQLEGVRRKYSWEEDGTFHDGAIYGFAQAESPQCV